MALRTELHAAWRALADQAGATGWRTIPIDQGGPCALHAGRHFPGNEEAIVVSFNTDRSPPPNLLPQGRGFLVSQMEGATTTLSIALRRQPSGNLDLFAMMAVDVMSALKTVDRPTGDRLLHAFLSRIRAWQDFMGRDGDAVLSAEAELGLFGELELMHDLLGSGLPQTVVVEGWMGPMDGLQDYLLGTGAVEVKSTLSTRGFPVLIGSLEQLDDALIQPLFLAALRLRLDASGHTLTESITSLRTILDPGSRATFDNRLIHAGFFDASGDRYTRRFVRVESRILAVKDDFPRLTRRNTALEIQRVRYELDLDQILAADVGLDSSLRQLGVAN